MRLLSKLSIAAVAAFASVFSFAGTSYAAPPFCVANMLSGVDVGAGTSFHYRDVKVVLHREDSAFVGYSTGMFTKDPNGTTASASLTFEFSDRVSAGQNFTNTSTVPGSLTVNLSTGALTVNVFGVNFGPVVPSCANNLSFYTTNNLEFWQVSFGPVQQFIFVQ